jgi:hypothetical protein
MSGRALFLTKERYEEIRVRFTNIDSEMKDKFLKELCEVLSFDPDKSSYNEAQKECIKKYRDRKKLEGISTYISSGNKKCYEKKKALKTNS